MSDPAPPPPKPELAQVALRGLCPRCGEPTLFAGVLRFAERCSACRLDFSQFNVGDGPAAFLTLIIGTLVTVAALVVEAAYSPPYWLHALLWLPLTVITVMASLRIAKAALLGIEMQRTAREGRIQQERDE